MKKYILFSPAYDNIFIVWETSKNIYIENSNGAFSSKQKQEVINQIFYDIRWEKLFFIGEL